MSSKHRRRAAGVVAALALVAAGCAAETRPVMAGGGRPALEVQPVTVTAAPAPAEVQRIELWRDDIRLAGTLEVPRLAPGERVPLVIVMHGFSGNQNEPLIRATAEALHNARIATLRFDFDGHGASGGRQEDMTVPGEIADAQVVYDYARGLPFVSTIGLAGHSQGGVVASMLAGHLGDNVSAMALFAPASIIPEATRSGSILGAQFDPNNPPDVITSVNDYRVGRAYILSAQTLPLEQVASQYAGPVTLIQGADDRAVPPAASEQFVTVFRDAELHELPGQDHVFAADPAQPAELAADFLAARLH
ncbi:alpha/beta hydrolase [Mycolicibacterium canariasense]|nr:alpha/beta fold hydrolase [Mycolicibacterium canariasense]MCV7213435.1 alpha/beta fold hydrolase [Mycolicibacterium canariasense]